MKIAVNINQQFREMTGIQHSVDSLLNAFYALKSPHEITAFAPNLASTADLDDLAQDGLFDWWRLPGAHVDIAGNDFLFAEHWRLMSRINRHVRPRRIDGAARQYDLMHMPEPLALASVPNPPAKTVVTIYDMTTVTAAWAHVPGGIAEWVPYFEYAKNKAARVITISEFSKTDIVKHLGIPADRVDVTPLAARAATRRVIDPLEIALTHRKFELTDAPFVLYAGTLEPRKNLRRLVKAFASAVQDGRLTDCKLVLAGGNWDRHDLELRLLALELGLPGRLIVTGYVSNEEMNVLMSSCAAFAYVSEYEGFGLPALEAMTCGAPVVTSNTTSLPEVVGDAGLMVDPTDVTAIAGALHCLLTDCTENARRRAMSLARAGEFSWERTARLTLQSYVAALA
jgi:glycosyltransferase involved in cell wall biosynthesis